MQLIPELNIDRKGKEEVDGEIMERKGRERKGREGIPECRIGGGGCCIDT